MKSSSSSSSETPHIELALPPHHGGKEFQHKSNTGFTHNWASKVGLTGHTHTHTRWRPQWVLFLCHSSLTWDTLVSVAWLPPCVSQSLVCYFHWGKKNHSFHLSLKVHILGESGHILLLVRSPTLVLPHCNFFPRTGPSEVPCRPLLCQFPSWALWLFDHSEFCS